jgi:serine/threonine-protein kinase
MDHLDEKTARAFVTGNLSRRRARAVDDHVEQCNTCRLLLKAISREHFRKKRRTTSAELVTDPEIFNNQVIPGQRLAGRFVLGDVLGEGGAGIVHEATDEQLKVTVALKLIRPEILLQHPDWVEQLEKELVLARRISHPNVCRVYDLGQSGPLHFITMERLQGETLEEVLERYRLVPLQALDYLDQVAAALHAAHTEGVVHRDLKPSNIMVGHNHRVVVMDFGLARDLSAEPSVRLGPVGTPTYWSPEQARGQPVTSAADIYSFGVIAFQILSGLPAERVVEKNALEAVPAPFRPLVETCLQADPRKRYSSALELAQALSEARRRFEWSSGLRKRWVKIAGIFALAVVGLVGTAILVSRVGKHTAAPSASTSGH